MHSLGLVASTCTLQWKASDVFAEKSTCKVLHWRRRKCGAYVHLLLANALAPPGTTSECFAAMKEWEVL